MARRSPFRLLLLAGALLIAPPVGRSDERPRPDAAGRKDAEHPTADAPASRPCTRPAAPRHDVEGVPNFARVSDALYRGGQPTSAGFRRLRAMGVKTVVNLRSFHSDRAALRGTGLGYVHIYCKAWHPEDEDTLKFLKVVADPANRPVFVHCWQGADRTGCAVAAYRVVEQGWTAEEAAAELPNFGFNPVWRQITRYLRHFDDDAARKRLRKTEKPDIDVVE